MTQVLYWQGVIGCLEIQQKYKSVIDKLLFNPNHASLHLEKLSNTNIYSARINNKARLIFTTYEFDSKKCLLILELLENHKYKNCAFLKRSVVKDYLLENQKNLNLEANNLFTPISEVPLDIKLLTTDKSSLIAKWDSQPVHFMHEKFIIFNKEQNQAKSAEWPLLLSGMAGSGKTSVILRLILQQLLNSNRSSDKQLYYITQSNKLALDAQQQFINILYSEGFDDVEINESSISCPLGQIYFYNKELLNHNLIKKNHVFESNQKCIVYIKSEKNKFLNKGKTDLSSTSLIKNSSPKNLFNVLTLLNGLPGTLEQKQQTFMELGARQLASFTTVERQWLISINNKLLAYFEQNKLFNINIKNISSKIKCNGIFVDEAHLFSLQALVNLRFMAQGKIVYCMDSNQDLVHSRSVRAILLHINNLANKKLNHVILPRSHRCSQSVSKLANSFLLLKQQLYGAGDKSEAIEMLGQSSHQGRCYLESDLYLKNNPNLVNDWLLQDESAVPIIIFNESERELAQAKFKSSFILLPQQIIGLEYKSVIIYLSNKNNILYELEKKCNQSKLILDDLTPSASLSSKRSLNEIDQNILLFLRCCFVAVTRAKTRALIYHNPKNKRTSVLHGILSKYGLAIEEATSTSITKFSSASLSTVKNISSNSVKKARKIYLIEAQKQQQQGNVLVANSILIDECGFSEALAKKIITKNQSTNKLTIIKTDRKIKKIKKQKVTPKKLSKKTSPIKSLSNRQRQKLKKQRRKLKQQKEKKLKLNKTTPPIQLKSKDALDLVEQIILNDDNLKNGVYKLSYLAIDSEGIKLLDKHWSFFKSKFTYASINETIMEEEYKGATLLVLLTSWADGLLFLDKHWQYFNTIIDDKNLNKSIEIGRYKDLSPLLFITANINKPKLLIKYWSDFKSKVTSKGLNTIIKHGDLHGRTVLYYLLIHSEYCQLFNDKRDFFVEKITAESINSIVLSGDNKGATPLLFLCANQCDLVAKYWNFFSSIIKRESFLCKTITSKSNKSALYYLLVHEKGRELFINNWDYFKQTITKLTLNEIINRDNNTKTSILYILSYYNNTLLFLMNNGSFFSELVTADGLNQLLRSNQTANISVLSILTSSVIGQEIIFNNWDSFQMLISKNALNTTALNKYDINNLNQVVENAHTYKSVSPLLFLTSSINDSPLLLGKWSFFKKIITEQGLNQAANFSDDKNISALFLLLSNSNGIKLLSEQWTFFKTIINQDGLTRIVTDGHYKGLSALFYLVTNNSCLNLLANNWDFFKPLITKQSLNQKIENSVNNGASTLSLLISDPIGLKLYVEHPVDFKLLVTSEGFNQRQEQSMYENASALLFLLSKPLGLKHFINNWSYFKKIITKDGLNRVMNKGAFDGLSALYLLIENSAGRQFVAHNIDEFKTFISYKALTTTYKAENKSPLLILLNDGWQGEIILQAIDRDDNLKQHKNNLFFSQSVTIENVNNEINNLIPY